VNVAFCSWQRGTKEELHSNWFQEFSPDFDRLSGLKREEWEGRAVGSEPSKGLSDLEGFLQARITILR